MTNALTRRSLLATTGGGVALGRAAPASVRPGSDRPQLRCLELLARHDPGQIAKFEAANPGVKVTLTDYTWKDYFDAMVLRFRGSTPTQVMYCGEDWLPGWALAGWLVPIEDKFPEDRQVQGQDRELCRPRHDLQRQAIRAALLRRPDHIPVQRQDPRRSRHRDAGRLGTRCWPPASSSSRPAWRSRSSMNTTRHCRISTKPAGRLRATHWIEAHCLVSPFGEHW